MTVPTEATLAHDAAEQLRIFRAAATLLASSLEFGQTLANVIEACLPALGDFGFFDVRIDGEVRRTVRAFEDPATEQFLGQTRWQYQDCAELNLCALSSGRAGMYTDIDDDWYRRVAQSPEHLAGLRRLAFNSMLTVPMYYGDELLGSLTLFMGRSRRNHTAADLEFVTQLAALAAPLVVNVRLLETQRRAETALRASEERLRLATEAASIGTWDLDIATGKLTWSESMYRLLGVAPADCTGSTADFARLLHPDDYADVSARARAAIRGLDGLVMDFRIVRPDGTLRWLTLRAQILRDASGWALRMLGALADITERMQSEERLRDLNARLEQRIETSNSERDRIWRMSQDILGVASFDGYFVSINPAATAILGWSEHEFLTVPFMDLIHPEHRAEFGGKLAELAAGKPLERYEVRALHRQGGFRWLSWTIVPEGGLIYGIGRDITELHKQREELLRASEARLQLALEVGGMGAWQWDLRTGVGLWWPGMDAVHGLPRGTPAMNIVDYADLIHPDDRAMVTRAVEQALGEGRGYRIEYRVVWPDRSVHWIEARSELALDEQGEPLQMAGVCVDITARKRTEQNLRFLARASAELADLVDIGSTLDKVVHLAVPAFADWCVVDLIDEQGDLKRVAVAHVDPTLAPLAYELHERFPADPVAQTGTWKIIKTGKASLTPEISEAMLRGGLADPAYADIMIRLGVRSYIGAPLTVRGKTLGAILFASADGGRRYGDEDVALAEDLGRRAAVAIENSNLYRTLRETDRRKDDFLAMLSHELRNPLAPIRAGADLLRMPIGEAAIRRTSDVISRQVDHMTGLIDDLLDVSRVTRGLVSLERAPVDLARVVHAAVEQARPLIEARRHTLRLPLDGGALLVEGDEKRLVQVLVNLLNNAAKYTPEGGQIEIEVDAQVPDAPDCAELRVRDNGTGMAPALARSAFDLFVQGERPSDRSQGGLGLGLALVKSLVELHAGSVRAYSKGAGLGSTFTVRLPLLRACAVPGTPQAPTTARLLPAAALSRVLVVDDNVDAAQMLAVLLQAAGHRTHVCHDARAALDWLAHERADVCLLDIGLPDIDGNALAAAIRRLPGKAPLLVAVTGYGQERDRDTALAAGFDHFLLKPINTAQLLALLSPA
jgi:PAS domain S-box-containing protein